MNVYKKKLDISPTDRQVDERQQLNEWYSQVVTGADVRDQVMVTGSNISRGVFGLISVDTISADDSNPLDDPTP